MPVKLLILLKVPKTLLVRLKKVLKIPLARSKKVLKTKLMKLKRVPKMQQETSRKVLKMLLTALQRVLKVLLMKPRIPQKAPPTKLAMLLLTGLKTLQMASRTPLKMQLRISQSISQYLKVLKSVKVGRSLVPMASR